MGKSHEAAPIWRSWERREDRKQARQARERQEQVEERAALTSWWQDEA